MPWALWRSDQGRRRHATSAKEGRSAQALSQPRGPDRRPPLSPLPAGLHVLPEMSGDITRQHRAAIGAALPTFAPTYGNPLAPPHGRGLFLFFWRAQSRSLKVGADDEPIPFSCQIRLERRAVAIEPHCQSDAGYSPSAANLPPNVVQGGHSPHSLHLHAADLRSLPQAGRLTSVVRDENLRCPHTSGSGPRTAVTSSRARRSASCRGKPPSNSRMPARSSK